MNNNAINKLEFLSGHGKLERLNLADNKIQCIPHLYGLISLKFLCLTYPRQITAHLARTK